MIHVLAVFLYLVHTVQGTSSTCQPSNYDGTPRTVWSILATCAFTLLICVWQAIHDDIPSPNLKWYKARLLQGFIILLSFLLPEWTVCIAGKQWSEARRKVKEFRGMIYPTDTPYTPNNFFFRQRARMVDDAQLLCGNGWFLLLRKSRLIEED